MREVQGKHFRCDRHGLGPVRRKALADSIDRPYLEDVGRAVDEAGDRMGGVRGTGRSPRVPPVDPVFVIGDLRASVVLRRVPGQHDLTVSAQHRQVLRRARHGRSRCATTAGRSGWWRGWIRRWWRRWWWWRWRWGWRRRNDLEDKESRPRVRYQYIAGRQVGVNVPRAVFDARDGFVKCSVAVGVSPGLVHAYLDRVGRVGNVENPEPRFVVGHVQQVALYLPVVDRGVRCCVSGPLECFHVHRVGWIRDVKHVDVLNVELLKGVHVSRVVR